MVPDGTLSASSPPFGSFGECGWTKEDACRRRARDRAQDCMGDHLSDTSARPASCEAGNHVENYMWWDLSNVLSDSACSAIDQYFSPPENFMFRAHVTTITSGDDGCGAGNDHGEIVLTCNYTN
jgi:hypothetical protein